MSGIIYSQDGKQLLSVYSSITSFTVQSSAVSIYGKDADSNTFSQCKNSIISVSFLEDSCLEEIQPYSFYSCIKLTTVDIHKCSKLYSIGNYAFYGCSSLLSIQFPSSMGLIGSYAFHSCSSITSPIKIPQNVSSIGSCCFYDCYNITIFEYEDNCLITVITRNVFRNSGIEALRIPKNLKSIEHGGLEGMLSMKTITIEENSLNFKVENNMLLNFAGKTCHYCPINSGSSLKAPDGITMIESLCFASNKATSITLPVGLISIKSYGFYKSQITSVVLPSTVTSLEGSVFERCLTLSNIIVSESLQNVGSNCFASTAIKNITFHETLTSVGNSCFLSCLSLVSVYFPSSLTSFGGGLFTNCPKLVNITFAPGSNFSISDDHLFLMKNDKTVIYQYLGKEDDTDITISDVVEEIASSTFSKSKIQRVSTSENSRLRVIRNSAFSGCTLLSSFVFPSSLTTIEYNAFYGCTMLSTPLISSNISSIDEFAFYNCKSIESVDLSSSEQLTSLSGESIFSGCTKLFTIKLPSTITSIGNNIFSSTIIEEITLPETLTSIGENAFSHCSIRNVIFETTSSKRRLHNNNERIISKRAFCDAEYLISIVFPSNVKIFDTLSFSNTGFVEITIPSTVTSIKQEAFKGCLNLETVTTESSPSLETLEMYVFQKCPKLRTIQINNNYFTVENSALMNSDRTRIIMFPPASDIKNFALLEHITEIGPAAFLDCKNLVHILIPDRSLITIGIDAFSGCTNLKFINFPKSIENVYSGAFTNCSKLSCGIEVEDNDYQVTQKLIEAGLTAKTFRSCSRTCEHKSSTLSITNMCLILTQFIQTKE